MRRSLAALAVAVLIGAGCVGASVTSVAMAAATHHRARPAAEHVSGAVHRVTLRYIIETTSPAESRGQGRTRTVSGTKATRLVKLFNALKREPKGYLHCALAGGPQTTVTFHGPHHTWVAKESACTNVLVSRDGKSLPTLLPSKTWTKTVNADLGR